MSNHNELLASQRVLSMLESACENSEQILDNIPSVFVALNQENRVIRANKAFCDLVGCTMETALHLDFTSFFTSENRQILLHHLDQTRQDQVSGDTKTNKNVKLEIGGNADDQPSKPFLWRMFPLEHLSCADGQVISVIGDDLSSIYQAELKLMGIFASIPLGLMVMDAHGGISEVLSEYCHVLLDEPELVGASLQLILKGHNPELQTELAQTFDALKNSIGKSSTDFTNNEAVLSRIKDLRVGCGAKERWIRLQFQPIAKNDMVNRYMVILEDKTSSYLAQQQIEKADILGKQAQALYECAIRDPLSGLYTRLFMKDSVCRLVSSARRGNLHELSIVMFDLDNFKKVNDTYGHDAGDRVIEAFGRIARACTRDTDLAVRYGGEEFLLALPCNDTNQVGGMVVAERIRETLANTPIDIGNGQMITVTTSCGLACCRPDDTIESLVQRADKLLYTAKHNGKNRMCSDKMDGE